MIFTTYDEYLKIQAFLISKNSKNQNKKYQNELDYLYQTKLKTPKQNETNINKMKEVGKIYKEKKSD